MKLAMGKNIVDISPLRVREAHHLFLRDGMHEEHRRLIDAILSDYCRRLDEEAAKVSDLQATIDFLGAMPGNAELVDTIGKAIEEYEPQPSFVDQVYAMRRYNSEKAEVVEAKYGLKPGTLVKCDQQAEPESEETWRDRPPML